MAYFGFKTLKVISFFTTKKPSSCGRMVVVGLSWSQILYF